MINFLKTFAVDFIIKSNNFSFICYCETLTFVGVQFHWPSLLPRFQSEINTPYLWKCTKKVEWGRESEWYQPKAHRNDDVLLDLIQRSEREIESEEKRKEEDLVKTRKIRKNLSKPSAKQETARLNLKTKYFH